MKGISLFLKRDKKNKETVALLLAINLAKGLKKDELAYLTALVEVKPDVQIKTYDDVAKLLNEYKDMMLSELSKDLPARREIDHRIELILGSVPLTRPPYHMSLLELVELRIQLFELFNIGIIVLLFCCRKNKMTVLGCMLTTWHWTK